MNAPLEIITMTPEELRAALQAEGVSNIDDILNHVFSYTVTDPEGNETEHVIVEDVRSISEALTDRSILETHIDDYTVSEGLLLAIFVLLFVSACARIIRGAFRWLS